MFLLSLLACGELGNLPDLDGDAQNARDCARLDGAVFVDAAEVQNGLDDNCDGTVDEGTAAYDDDGDGSTDAGGDCNDADPTVFPSQAEAENNVDDDCDGVVDEGTAAFDDDGDGVSENDGDCDDEDPTRSPLFAESCDGVDDDCDEVVDNGFDIDADGYTSCADDADDLDPTVYPGAQELCDGVDNDQNGAIDETCDVDGDGFTSFEAEEYDGNDGDCDDNRAEVYPGAAELCDSLDNDCDGATDGRSALADDPDHDGFACENDCDESNAAVNSGMAEAPNYIDDDCDQLVDEGWDVDGDGYIPAESGAAYTADRDCDDLQADTNPGASEACNGQDDDCDGEVDDGFDVDGDGVTSCAGDCDDTDATIYLGNVEDLNARDDNCDGVEDEDVGLIMAVDLDVEVAASDSESRTIPLPQGEYSDFEVLVFPTAAMDDGDGFCGWTSDWAKSGTNVEVTIDTDDCKNRTGEWQAADQGYASKFDILVVASAGSAVEMLSSGIGTGGNDFGYGGSATLGLSSTAGSSFSACVLDNRDEGSDRDWDWHMDCIESGGTLSTAIKADDCRDTGWVSGTSLIVGGFSNLTVSTESFEAKGQDTFTHGLASTLGDDHLTLFNITKMASGSCEDNLNIDTTRTTSGATTTIESNSWGTGNAWWGEIRRLDGRFIYWQDGNWNY